jgi:hypothetical protein
MNTNTSNVYPVQAIATIISSVSSKLLNLDHALHGSIHAIVTYGLDSLRFDALKDYINFDIITSSYNYIFYIVLLWMLYNYRGTIINKIYNFNTESMIISDPIYLKSFVKYTDLNKEYFSSPRKITIGNINNAAKKKIDQYTNSSQFEPISIKPSPYEKIRFLDKSNPDNHIKGYFMWTTRDVKIMREGKMGATANQPKKNFFEDTVDVDCVEIYINKYYNFKRCHIMKYIDLIQEAVTEERRKYQNKWYIKIYKGSDQGMAASNYLLSDGHNPIDDKNIFIDTFFHDNKNEILSNLCKVDGDKEYFYQMGQIPRAGYCLYGPPGSGKTNFVYRMARYFNRNIMSIDIKRITKSQLLSYFDSYYNPKVNAHIHTNDIIYFFDEFDEVILELKKRQACIDAHYDKIKSGAVNVTPSDEQTNGRKVNGYEDTSNEITNMSNLITFNDLLELFSGISPLEGVMIMVATNNFEMVKQIIPALFRDGRLTPVYFGYFNGRTIKEICNKYYKQAPEISDELEPNIMNSQLMETILNTHKLDNGYELFMKKYSSKLIKEANETKN